MNPEIYEAAKVDPFIANALREGVPLDWLVVELHKQKLQLMRELSKLQDIAPRKWKLSDGRTVVWHCPDEIVPLLPSVNEFMSAGCEIPAAPANPPVPNANPRLRGMVHVKDGRCGCDAGTKCPLGKTGSEERCTAQEILAAGFGVTTGRPLQISDPPAERKPAAMEVLP